MEAVECGAASLAMILAHHGLHRPLPELRAACGVNRDGSKAANVLKAARSYGMEAKGYKKELAALFELKPPFVVFWNFNHFLVVEGWDARSVWLNDPAVGKRTLSHAEFDQGFTGVALTFTPGPAFAPGGKPPALWPSVRERLATSGPALAYCLLAGLFLVLPNLAVPVLTQVFVDSVLVKGFADWLPPLLIGMALAAALTGALRILQALTLARLGLKLSIALTGRFLWHVFRLPTGFFAQRFTGEIANRLWLNDKVADALAGPIATTAVDVLMLLAYGAAMFAYDPVLAAVGIGLAGLNLVALRLVNRRLAARYAKLGQEQGKADGASIAGLGQIETLKASGLESDFFARWAGYYAKALNTQQRMARETQALTVLPALLSALAGMAILVVGGLRVLDGALTIGMLVGFQALMQRFLEPVSKLMGLNGTLNELKADLNRLDDVLGHPQALPERAPAAPASVPHLEGHLSLCGVSFGFSPCEPPLIEGFDLTLKPGQRVALVGGSGSGKSTIAKLIAGLYAPTAGEIRFDGVRREDLPPEALAAALAMVDQELFLFSGPVRDNLTLWDETVPEPDLVRACRDADVLEIVAALPGGFEGVLAEGASNLSGGQRQRLEIARALVRDPAILVLDEATSALDSESERVIDKRLRQRGCTCVIVAHRLSTIRDCDEIIVLERGKVVQRGTHDALKAEGGYYARLIAAEGGALQEAGGAA